MPWCFLLWRSWGLKGGEKPSEPPLRRSIARIEGQNQAWTAQISYAHWWCQPHQNWRPHGNSGVLHRRYEARKSKFLCNNHLFGNLEQGIAMGKSAVLFVSDKSWSKGDGPIINKNQCLHLSLSVATLSRHPGSNVVAGERQVLKKLQSDEVSERRNASEERRLVV